MVVMKEAGRGLSWILGSQVGHGAVSSLIFLTCKKKQIGSGYRKARINPQAQDETLQDWSHIFK